MVDSKISFIFVSLINHLIIQVMEIQGVNIKEQNVKSILEGSKLGWGVRTEGLMTASGIEIAESVAIIRNDTNKVLSVRGEGYQPYQNEELAELLYRVSNKTGLQVHRGGFFGDGEKVFIQLKSDDLKMGADRIEGFLTGINSFDGSTSLAFGPSSLTISCRNTFFAAFRQMTTKIRHTKNMVIRVEDVCQKLEAALGDEKEIFTNIVKLSETRFDKVVQDAVTRQLFKIPKDVALTDQEQISTRTRNQMSRFYIDLNGELQEKGDNLWGLFSGVTKFTTHSLSTEKKKYNSDQKMYDQYGDRERSIFNHLVELV